MTRQHSQVPSPVGTLTLVVDDDHVVGLYLPGHRPAPDPAALGTPHEDPLPRARVQIEEYFCRQRRSFDLPLAPVGTAFQRQVWDALTRIEYGSTATYAQVAAAIGRPTAVRAVGMANSRNPISIIVPCHRVIGADGALTGYAGGVERKRQLLDLEAAQSDPTP